MGTFSSEFIIKNDGNESEFEAFLNKRNKSDKTDDSIPWLITFADLMTILLVFSFVMFITTHKNNKAISMDRQISDTITSLLPVAHANTSSDTEKLSVPVYICDKASKSEQAQDEEKTILRKSIHFDPRSTTLSKGFKSDLHEIAEFSKNNLSSKIIITADIGSRSKLSIRRAMNIVDHLIKKCSIEKEKVFLQTFQKNPSITSSPAHENISEGRTIEVKLIKAFWWF